MDITDIVDGWLETIRAQESFSGEARRVAGATCPRVAGLGRVAALPWCRSASTTATPRINSRLLTVQVGGRIRDDRARPGDGRPGRRRRSGREV